MLTDAATHLPSDCPSTDIRIQLHGPATVDEFLTGGGPGPFGRPRSEHPSHDLRWLRVLRDGLGHVPYCVSATRGVNCVGVLPLVLVQSRLFGRYLVSLPYLNSAGLQCSDSVAAEALVQRAVELADELDVKHLELRHETEQHHPALTQSMTSKVHMRLALPATTSQLRHGLKAKVRNQVRKGERQGFSIDWGGQELLRDFYAVFSRNMRDLGTPVFGRGLFRSVLHVFSTSAELCLIKLGSKPVAAALLVHGTQTTEVPSASALRKYSSTNANMFMYWHLLCRAVERGNHLFDFGRSSRDSNTYRFKKQWGAQPHPAVWQYYVRRGEIQDVRPESKKFQRAIRIWQKLPLPLTRLVGPRIIRGIP